MESIISNSVATAINNGVASHDNRSRSENATEKLIRENNNERYLALTPERFRRQLNTRSPKRGKRRWRNDAELMRFVDSL